MDVEMADIKQEPTAAATAAGGGDQDMNSDSHGVEGGFGQGGNLTAQQLKEQQQRKLLASSNPNGIGPNDDPYDFGEDGKNGSKQVKTLQ